VGKTSDKALSEFLSEGQEIIDALNHNLLRMDQRGGGPGAGTIDPDLVNECFRGVHSLKGLSGLFGFQSMTAVSHTLESLLDSLRLGRVKTTPDILDLLFEAVELFTEMFGAAAEGREVALDRVSDYLDRTNTAALAARAGGKEPDALSQYAFPPNILSVLTEYEEHRLLENIKQGRTIYRVRAAFELMNIDTGLEKLKERIKLIGEVITYLPSADSIDDTSILLDLLIGTSSSLDAVRAKLQDEDVDISAVPRAGATAEPSGGAVHAQVDEQLVAAALQSSPPAAAATADSEPPAPPPTPAAAAPADGEQTEESIRSVSQTVRVDIRKLDSLMNAVSELTIAHAGIAEILARLQMREELSDEVRMMSRELRSLERRLGDLQGGILEVRMVPLRQVFDKLSRVVRKISRESGKEIRLEISGADTELDKLIVEELSDPLMHIIRNSIDHGIELPGVREAAGKPAIGTIRVVARQQGSRVVVTISDDGAGIDEARVADVAVERGIAERAQLNEMSQRELLNLLFLPGMSTRDVATELSGRGVGLDVVKTNIARLSGLIDVYSEPGQGTEFVITLPITLAIIQALVIRSAGRLYTIPLNSVLETLLVTRSEIRTVEGNQVLSLRSQTLPLQHLDRLFRLPRTAPRSESETFYVVVIGLAQHRLGLIVDELVGERDIVIKPLVSTLAAVPGIAGATELGHQTTVLVLDVPGILEEVLRLQAAPEAA
jgi:two-component system, chemotaxis family, sensor kinase CheA